MSSRASMPEAPTAAFLSVPAADENTTTRQQKLRLPFGHVILPVGGQLGPVHALVRTAGS